MPPKTQPAPALAQQLPIPGDASDAKNNPSVNNDVPATTMQTMGTTDKILELQNLNIRDQTLLADCGLVVNVRRQIQRAQNSVDKPPPKPQSLAEIDLILFFHFVQACTRQIRDSSAEMRQHYSEDTFFAHKLKMLMALALIPPQDVIVMFNEYERGRHCPAIALSFLQYFEKNYIGKKINNNPNNRETPRFAIQRHQYRQECDRITAARATEPKKKRASQAKKEAKLAYMVRKWPGTDDMDKAMKHLYNLAWNIGTHMALKDVDRTEVQLSERPFAGHAFDGNTEGINRSVDRRNTSIRNN